MRKLALLGMGIVIFVLDRVIKMWVLASFTLGEAQPLIPGIVGLRYTRNTGMAFSFLVDHQWVPMIGVPLILIGLGIVLYKRMFSCPVQQLCVVALMAGGFGNWLDRILYGYVVDMFELLFMNFAVFNVADIFITLSAPVFFIAYLIGERRKKEEAVSDES